MPWGINPSQKHQPFSPSRPLNLQTFQAPFLGDPPNVSILHDLPNLSVNPQNIHSILQILRRVHI